MYRAGIEGTLGLRRSGEMLLLDPHIPLSWPMVEIHYTYLTATYHISISRAPGDSRGVAQLLFDDVALATDPLSIPLVDDGLPHRVQIMLGSVVPQ